MLHCVKEQKLSEPAVALPHESIRMLTEEQFRIKNEGPGAYLSHEMYVCS